jgi:1,4-alpha-glucan branching enzyme
LAEGFAFQGEMMEYRGKARGEPSRALPPTAFVAFIQNHDQIGNRAFGDRLGASLSTRKLRAIAATYLLLPQVPMLFMGEEWNAGQPFPFFCDFDGELGKAVRDGRRAEFARFAEFQDPEKRERIPDPLALATFESAKLDWHVLSDGMHAEWLEWYRLVLAVRRDVVVPLIPRIGGQAGRYEVLGDGVVAVTWEISGGGRLWLDANLSDAVCDESRAAAGRVIWQEGEPGDAWSVRWSLSA